MAVNKFEQSAIIAGIGRSAVGRRLGRSELSLTVEAARVAIADAGLSPKDIDGLVAWPGEYPAPPGFTGPSPWRLKDALRLESIFTDAGLDYGVEADEYRGGVLFHSVRVGAFFYVLPEALGAAHEIMRRNGYKPAPPETESN